MSTSAQALSWVEDLPQDLDGRYDDGWETDFPRRPHGSSIHDSIPDGLDRTAPGPVLGAFLASIDVNRLSGYDRLWCFVPISG